MRQTLLPLLDTLPKSKAEALILHARGVARRYAGVPKIDLGMMKVEVNNLLDDISRVAKSKALASSSDGGFGGGTLHHGGGGGGIHDEDFESVIYEAVESITSWLNDVWSTAYEYGVDFLKMHSCLVFSIGVVDHIQTIKGG